MLNDYYGVGGVIVLVLDIWAIINVLGSGRGAGEKALWTASIIILPVLGFLIWFFAGPKSSRV